MRNMRPVNDFTTLQNCKVSLHLLLERKQCNILYPSELQLMARLMLVNMSFSIT